MPQISVQSFVYFVVFAAFSRHRLLLRFYYCHVTEMELCDWSIEFSHLIVNSHLWLMVSNLVNEINFKCNFRAFPM